MKEGIPLAKQKEIINDFTTGSIPKKMLLFSVPFMVSNLMQVLYSLVDMVVVGQFVGSFGLSAVSVASQIFMFMTMVCLGFSNGGQVLIAQLIGAGRRDKLNAAIGTLFSLIMLMGAAVMLIGLVFGKGVLTLMNTPPESFDMAVDYVLVCSIGVIFSYGYNMVSAVLRGMGDSRHPFIFVMIASIINIILDLLFVGVFRWSVAGAALATILGQAFSFLYALFYLYRNKESFGFDFKLQSYRIDPEMARQLARLGIPFAVQSAAINISMMFVNSLVNSVGVYASAVFGVGIKVDDIVNKVTQGVTFAVSSMVGQNIAAGKQKRVQKTLLTSWIICGICYLVFALLLVLFVDPIFSLFTSDPEVIELAPVFVSAILWSFPAMALMKGTNGMIQGVGNAKLSLIFGLLDAVVLRIGLSWLLGIELGFGLYGFFLGYGLAAYGTAIPGLVYYLSGRWKTYAIVKKED